MPYFATSQEYLKQSALLLEAYPDTTRITTKYSYPKKSKSKSESSKSKPSQSATATAAPSSTTTPTTPTPATLTLKTYNPAAGICLKYQTNKGAEVGRLITALGKLASGASIEELTTTSTAAAAQIPSPAGEDVEMVDAAAVEGAKGQQGSGGGKAAKGKKKGGKGKR